MDNVIELHGVCEAQNCKRGERLIASEADKAVVRNKNYHKGCEPTPEQLAAADRA
jgi:hypothetical protein